MPEQNDILNHVIAHRGLQRLYPENSCLAIQGALEAGIRHIELDVQFSVDGQPMLFHDANLNRVCKKHLDIFTLHAEELLTIPAYEPKRFQDTFITNTIAPLSAIIPFLLTDPDVHFYIELKDHSIEHFGIAPCLDKIAQTLDGYLDRITLIGFNHAAICQAKSHHHFPQTGLVLKSTRGCVQKCREANVDIAFINVKRLYRGTIPPLGCPLAIYEINAALTAKQWLDRGVDKVESFCSDTLLIGLREHLSSE